MSRQYTGEWVVSSLLAERAERFGTEIAVASEHGSLTYEDLVARAARMAGGLASLGAVRGDRIATMLPTGNDYLAAWHACIWLGAIEVPVNVEYRGSFLEHILQDSGATILIVHARWLHRLGTIELSDIRHLVVVGEPDDEGEMPAGIATHAFADVLGHDPLPRHPSGELDLTYIMYTSGTTGRAKGAVHNNRSSIHYLMPFFEGLDLQDDDVCYSMFPLFHQMGRSACTTAALWAGNRVEIRAGFSASNFWDDIRACGATWMGYFGAVVLFLWQNPPSPGDRDHRLTRAFGSSAAQELMTAWEERFGVILHEVYGSTEIGLGSGLGPRLPAQARDDGAPVPAGRGGDRGRERQSAPARRGRRGALAPEGALRLLPGLLESPAGDGRCHAQPLVPLRRCGADRRGRLLRLQGPAQGHDPAARREHLVVRGRARGAGRARCRRVRCLRGASPRTRRRRKR